MRMLLIISLHLQIPKKQEMYAIICFHQKDYILADRHHFGIELLENIGAGYFIISLLAYAKSNLGSGLVALEITD